MHPKFSAHSSAYLERLGTALDAIDVGGVARFADLIESAIGTGRTVFFAGNGGSAATSSHMACDFGKTILGKDPRKATRRLRTLSLNDSIPTMTAWGNDESYDSIFAEQLKSLGRQGDILVVITGSGNSRNVLGAVIAAKSMGMSSFGLLGFDGGAVKELLDGFILVNSFDYGVVEDAHSIINHLVTDWFKCQSGNEAREPKQASEALATA